MDNPRHDPDFEYDDYEPYSRSELTNVGLPPGQLALIIGVNAVISLIISVVVVLIANRQVVPGDIATSPTTNPEVSVEAGVQTDAVVVSGENTPPPDSTPIQSVTYVVESGDTLGAIAAKFSVSLFDLMTVNGLSNQDFIQVGQELIIPLGGLPPTTPTFTPAPRPTDTPLPFDPPTPLPTEAAAPPVPAATVGPSSTPTQAANLTATVSIPTSTPLPTSTPASFDEINVTIDQLAGSGNLAQETVVILNKGAGVSLRDWKLEGSSLGIFVFPDIFLFSGGSIRVHTAAGQNTPSDLFLNQGEPAWPADTTIILRDNNNSEISRYKVSLP